MDEILLLQSADFLGNATLHAVHVHVVGISQSKFQMVLPLVCSSAGKSQKQERMEKDGEIVQ